MSLLSKFRDSIVEKFVRNHKLVKKFGEIQSITIDSEKGSATVTVLLHGEPAPMTFYGSYKFEDTDEGTFVVCEKIFCERQWINDALEFYLTDNPIRQVLPKIAGGLAKIIF